MDRLQVNRNRRQFLQRLNVALVVGLNRERGLWRREGSSRWWERIVLETFTDQQWVKNFRMTKETFEMLCDLLEDHLKPRENAFRDALDVKKQVAITLYWLGSTSEYRTVGHLFGVGKATVCKCVHSVCNSVVDALMEDYIKFPSGEDLQDVITGYEQRWGFPSCGGAIDGTHIPIKAPDDAHGDLLNRKGSYSVILQAVCDYKYIIRDVNIGWPGRVHDARVFGNSDLFRRGEEGTLFPNWTKSVALAEREIVLPVMLLGDPAYPLKPWLMKPYSHRGQLSDIQQQFNYRLSRARMTIENTFGRLKGRWRWLLKQMDQDKDFVCKVIATCIVLHNICEMRHEAYEDFDGNCENLREAARVEPVGVDRSGKRIRDDIASAFAENVV